MDIALAADPIIPRVVRDVCLNTHWFSTLPQARHIIAAWQHHYDAERPHDSANIEGKRWLHVLTGQLSSVLGRIVRLSLPGPKHAANLMRLAPGEATGANSAFAVRAAA